MKAKHINVKVDMRRILLVEGLPPSWERLRLRCICFPQLSNAIHDHSRSQFTKGAFFLILTSFSMHLLGRRPWRGFMSGMRLCMWYFFPCIYIGVSHNTPFFKLSFYQEVGYVRDVVCGCGILSLYLHWLPIHGWVRSPAIHHLLQRKIVSRKTFSCWQ